MKTSARRHRLQSRRTPTDTDHKLKISRKILFLVAIIGLVGCLAFFLIIQLGSKTIWGTSPRLSVVVTKDSGDMALVVFDEQAKTIATFTLPKNTEVTASRQLGKWKLGSIKALDSQEKLNGMLIRDTIVKTFFLPIDAWADEQFLGFTTGNIFTITKSVLGTYNTNLSRKDLMRIAILSAKVSDSDSFEVNLLQNNTLQKTTLPDGEEGFRFKSLPPSVASYFVDPQIASQVPRVAIYRSGSTYTSTVDVSRVLEIMGTNVLAIDDSTKIVEHCLIIAKDALIGKKIATLFGCSIDSSEPQGNFDIEIFLGSEFSKKF